jgi:hypothetical protein
MLGKLMKYEIKATQRIFLPLYGLILVFALLIKVFMLFNIQNARGMAIIPFVITMIIYCVLIAAVCVMTLVVTIQRFNKNLLGDEGYLSFTLPVKVHSHIDSKMIISLMWTVLSLIVSAVSIFILASDNSTASRFSDLWSSIGRYMGKYGFPAYLIFIEAVILMVVGSLTGILQLYASVTVGNLSSKHKLLAGFGTFIGFSVIEQIVGSVFVNTAVEMEKQGLLAEKIDEVSSMWDVAAGLGEIILIVAIFGIAFYFLTHWLLSKKLNLE